MSPNPPVEFEPLEDRVLECAALAHRIAPEFCGDKTWLGTDCSWYHGIWPYLRAVGVVTTLANHAAFYADQFGRLARADDFKRVLISGSCDFAMLQRVNSAFDAAARTPDVTFSDVCETPIKLAQWYADAVSRPVDTVVSDILTLKADAPFDIICTDSFMGTFTDESRLALIEKWHDLLRPGGKVVTINRIRPGGSPDRISFDETQVQGFVERARATFELREDLFDIGVEDFVAGAARFAENFWVRPIRSLEYLEQIFRDGGFDTDLLEIGYIAGKEKAAGAGPTTPEGAAYAHIVMTRV